MVQEVSNSGKVALWIGFVGMALPTIIFYLWYVNETPGKRKFHAITIGITGMASIAYLFMASGRGYYIVDDRQFYYMRYIDWVITTPLLLLDLCALAACSTEKTMFLILLDVLMIISGALGGLVTTGEKYVFWAMGMLFFIPIIYDLLVSLKANAAKAGEAAVSSFNTLALLTVVLWSAYPIVWILAEGEGTVSPDVEAILYVILDVTAKSGFGFLLLTSRDAIAQAVAASDPEGAQLLDAKQ